MFVPGDGGTDISSPYVRGSRGHHQVTITVGLHTRPPELSDRYSSTSYGLSALIDQARARRTCKHLRCGPRSELEALTGAAQKHGRTHAPAASGYDQ